MTDFYSQNRCVCSTRSHGPLLCAFCLSFHFKRNSRFIQSQKMAHSVNNRNAKAFWSEVKKIKCHKNIIVASLDEEVDEKRIADVFANKYRHLYNSVSYDPYEMKNVKNDVDARINCNGCWYMYYRSR